MREYFIRISNKRESRTLLGNATGIRMTKGLTFAGLSLIFLIAYLALPYWRVFPGTIELVIMAATIGVAVAWAGMSAGEVSLTVKRRDAVWLTVAVIGVAVFNMRALFADVPWMGDEDYHIANVQNLMSIAAHHPEAVAVLVFLCVSFLWCGMCQDGITRSLLFGCVLVALTIVCAIYLDSIRIGGLRRYPFLSYLVGACTVAVASFWRNGAPPEIAYRIIPMVSAALCIWYPFRIFTESIEEDGGKLQNLPDRVRGAVSMTTIALMMVTLATVPLMAYHSSLLYLEMPAVFLMMLVCFSSEKLLKEPPEKVASLGAWYALLLLGFVKETVAPFLAAFMLCRLVARSRYITKSSMKLRSLWSESAVIFCMLTPLATFLFHRMQGAVRPLQGRWGNIFEPEYFLQLVRSYPEQFGLILAFSAAGIVVLLRQRASWTLTFVVAVAAADCCLHVRDSHSLTFNYLGYGRFNLFLLPSIIVMATTAVVAGARRWPCLTMIALVTVIAGNIALSPMHADGSRRVGWGQSNVTNTDQTYPYRSACQWLNQNCQGKRILFAGMPWGYHSGSARLVEWYVGRHLNYGQVFCKRGNVTEAQRFDEALTRAKTEQRGLVLFHLTGEKVPPIPAKHRFVVIRIFRNSAHQLVLLQQKKEGSDHVVADGFSCVHAKQWGDFVVGT